MQKFKINCAQVPKLDHSFMLLAWDSSNAVQQCRGSEKCCRKLRANAFHRQGWRNEDNWNDSSGGKLN